MDEYQKYKLSLLAHALGGYIEDQWYRNFFDADEKHKDYPTLEALCDDGLMTRRDPPVFCMGSGILYIVTEKGKQFLRNEATDE
jgi:hypothetical protein